MDENIPEDVKKLIEMENKIWNYEREPLDEIISFIKEIDPIYFQELIYFISLHKYFNFKLLYDIIKHVDCIHIKFHRDYPFSQYLYLKGLIKKENFIDQNLPDENNLIDISIYEEPIQKDTIEYYIYTDDISNFVDKITSQNIDFNNYYFEIFTDSFFIMDFACFCSSINIFKYLIINDANIGQTTVFKAVEGGNEEIIQILETKVYPFFNDTLISSIEFHSNNVAKWIYERFDHELLKLPCCVYYFNTEMLIYFLSDQFKIDINTTSIFTKKTCLMYAANFNNIIVAKYLIDKGANKELKDITRKTAYFYARTKEMEDLLDILD